MVCARSRLVGNNQAWLQLGGADHFGAGIVGLQPSLDGPLRDGDQRCNCEMNFDHTSDWLPSAQALPLTATATDRTTRRRCLRSIASGCAVALMVGCQAPDRFAAKWEAIAIGDSRASVIAVLGPPSKTSAVAVPVLSAEYAIWEPPLGRRYTAYFAMGRVVAKASAD